MSSSRIVLALAVGVAAFVCATGAARAQAPDPALVERGEYLAKAGDCAGCHTAPGAGSSAFAGGYAIPSPMGGIIASNITPSKTHGIGGYSLKDFTRAVRDGVLPDGTHLYPAMPYTAYAGVTDQDIAALYAFFMLKVAPVDNSPPKTELPFPFNVRASMIGWNLLYAGRGTAPDPGGSPQTQRGRYLVEQLGHCGTCHTPRNALMGEKTSRFLGGGEVGGWHARNITPDPVAGIGAWTEDEIVAYQKHGFVPGKSVAAGPMAEAVEHSLRYLTDDDLRAIAAYLKTVPAVSEPGAARPAYAWKEARPAAVTSFETGSQRADLANAATLDGAILYNGACASCHGVDGAGTSDRFFPSLTSSTTVGSADPSNLVMTITEGVDRRGFSGHAFMQGFGEELTNAQIASVATYVAKRFGNPDVSVDEAKVAELRAGGPTPTIVKAGPAVAVAIALLVLVAVVIVVRLVRRVTGRKAPTA